MTTYSTAPALIHTGYHKTGTTWLQHHVFDNPEAGFYRLPLDDIMKHIVDVNALDFKAETCRETLAPHSQRAADAGLQLVVSQERLSGSPHTGGYDSKELADRLVKVFPNARVLIVIREQRSMCSSAYRQYLRGGGSYSLDEYLRPRRRKKPGFDPAHLQYHRLVRYYMELFGETNVCVLPYEMFRAAPMDFLATLLQFAGVPAEIERFRDVVGLKSNASRTHLRNIVKRRLNPFLLKDHDSLGRVLHIPGLRVIATPLLWLVDRLAPSALEVRLERKSYDTICACTCGCYAESNRITSRLTGLDLAGYGYET
ncbi:MAG: sulfotransferase [Kiritimatiellia bacterium]|jgi:hypothetical protein|nr:sulfotransferase [Kiritimatiellia bacterium]MDP6811442.1 sulfotransferase [Kiritimatiellia bacterium]MDP7024498.1 sulfotransferase [Kiritimatiellia bacterium]